MKRALWKALCSFSRRERQGIIVLLILTGVCWITPTLWEHYIPADSSVLQDSLLLAEVAAFREELSVRTNRTTTDSTGRRVKRFRFDPNTLSPEEWIALGVAPRIVRVIGNYLSKGGRFRNPEDLKRIYGIPPSLCRELMPYVSIIATRPKRKDTLLKGMAPDPVYNAIRRINTVSINTADSSEWESLPGIGPVLAARIVKFRDKLGGFYAISQVHETFGLPDSAFNKIQPYLRLYEVSLKKMDINHTDEQTLAQHPYIRYKLARLIILYRNNHGPFRDTRDLLGIPLVDDSIYRKIEHYIKTENSPL